MDVGQSRRHSMASNLSAQLDRGRRTERAQALLEAAHALCADALHESLRQCIGHFEQQLFAMAERARRSTEQQDCFASRQRVLQERSTFGQHFIGSVTAAFNTFDTLDAKPAAPIDAPAWHSLELLDPAEQELNMTLEQLMSRGEARHGNALYELGYRLAVLIGAPPLEGDALPLGPRTLAQAFQQASAGLELPLAHHVLWLHSFDQWVIQTLAPLYTAIDAQLQSAGILPHLRSIPVPRRSRPSAEESAAGAPTESVQSMPTASGAGTPPSGSIEVLESLRNLLAQQRTQQHPVPGQLAERAASADELQTALGALQQHLAQVTDQASRELRSAGRLREELLTQLNIGNSSDAPRTQLSGEQGDTVELVAMLFEQLGQQLQHGSNARALLGGLQLPMLRMAVADHGFFEQREHPARQLLDTVTAAANDWLDGSDDETDRPLAAKLEQLVSRASQEPPSAGLYTSLLADIEHHLGLLTRKAKTSERRHVEAAQGRERLDQARRRAAELMADRFAQSPPRGLLRALLDRAWADVLALTLLRHGEDSEAFATQLVITDQLLGRLPIGDRLQLQQDVETGLQQIGMHAEESIQVAQRLLGAGTPDPAVELPSATDLALRLKQHRRLGEPASPTPTAATIPTATPTVAAVIPAPTHIPGPRERQIEQHLRDLPFGSWFEFVDPDSGQLVRRKLAWYSRLSGRCLLVSRRGQRGEEMTLAQLAHEIAKGRVCELPTERGSLLDRAWRNLTSKLRQTAKTRHTITPEPESR